MRQPAAHAVRQAILELGSEAAAQRKSKRDLLDLRFIRNARRHWSDFAMADSSGRELTYGKALTATLLVKRWMSRERPDEEMIGLLLPPSVGGALANIGITMAGKVPVNLNFTAGREAMSAAIEKCGIRSVVTSKVFLAKAKLEQPEGAVFIEDILAKASSVEKMWALRAARLAPAKME
jgi:acyl-[acyl-carrier-protein]-phospholipid O-acyltransferase/long-chain-fatty-acid--[acyl-carrier-protein] ligase